MNMVSVLLSDVAVVDPPPDIKGLVSAPAVDMG
jgi:hypothetical protein